MRHPCEEAADAAKYLRSESIPAGLFATLHHRSLKGDKETVAATMRYFGEKNRNLGTRNLDYVQRLRFVSEAHQRSGERFATLVAKAIDKWPLKDN